MTFSDGTTSAELLDFGDFRDKRDCGVLLSFISIRLAYLFQGATVIIRWMMDYFTPPASELSPVPSTSINDVLGRTTPVGATQLMPVILQHKGHSRVIVGYQRHADGTVSLLTFDTGR